MHGGVGCLGNAESTKKERETGDETQLSLSLCDPLISSPFTRPQAVSKPLPATKTNVSGAHLINASDSPLRLQVVRVHPFAEQGVLRTGISRA